MMRQAIFLLSALAASAGAAAAQSFNVDVYQSASDGNPTPSDAYGGAAGQTGHWAAFGSGGVLEGLDGVPTGVQFFVSGFTHVGAKPNPATMGDDELLLDDLRWTWQGASPNNVVSGLAPGEYAFYTYAWDPLVQQEVEVRVTPSADPIETLGGPWPGGHVQGVTYALHRVSVGPSTNVVVNLSPAPGSQETKLSGLQIVKLDLGTPFCFGDGTANAGGGPVPCPCGNESALGAGEGCRNTAGYGAILSGRGSASVAAEDLYFEIEQGTSSQPGVLVQGASRTAVPFKDGILCAGNPTRRVEIVFLDAAGAGRTTSSIVANGNVSGPGLRRYYQFWYRDPGAPSPCAERSNFTSGVIIDWTP